MICEIHGFKTGILDAKHKLDTWTLDDQAFLKEKTAGNFAIALVGSGYSAYGPCDRLDPVNSTFPC